MKKFTLFLLLDILAPASLLAHPPDQATLETHVSFKPQAPISISSRAAISSSVAKLRTHDAASYMHAEIKRARRLPVR